MAQIRIPLMHSTFFDEAKTKEKLIDFIRGAKKLSMGEECANFEKEFATYQKRKHAVLVANGSVANLGLIQALLNLGTLNKGDRVGVSAVTWATNVMPLLQLGLIPVPIDCSTEHLNATSETLKKEIGNLKAFFITNALGFCGDIDVIKKMCDEHKVILLEDNCESLGTIHKGTILGNYGLASTFSFFVGHHMSTIEGGMICTDDDALQEMLVMVRAHGWDRALPPKRQKELRTKNGIDDFNAIYTFYESAFNIRTTEISGFLGRVQLPMLEGTIEKRGKNFARFAAAAKKKPDLYQPLQYDHIERLSNFAMPVVTKNEKILKDCIKRFGDAGVEIRPLIAGDITSHPFWKKALPAYDLPGARMIHELGFYAPNNPELTEEDVDLICATLSD